MAQHFISTFRETSETLATIYSALGARVSFDPTFTGVAAGLWIVGNISRKRLVAIRNAVEDQHWRSYQSGCLTESDSVKQ